MNSRIEDIVDEEQFDIIKKFITFESGEIKHIDWRAIDSADKTTETGAFYPEAKSIVLTALASAGILSTREEGNWELQSNGCLRNPYIKAQLQYAHAVNELLYFTRKEDAEAYKREVLKSDLVEVVQNPAA